MSMHSTTGGAGVRPTRHEATRRHALEEARAYAAAGLSVVPIKTDGSKRPVGGWKAAQSRVASPTEIERAFDCDCGVAIVHGAVSGGTEVVDIDTADLLDPLVETLDRLAPGLIARLCVVRTPRPGYHLVYRCGSPEGNQKLAMRPPRGDEKGPVCLIETRGEGGYTLAPGCPSGCHPSGGNYRHEGGPPLTDLPTITRAERDALLTAARSLDRMPADEPATAPPASPGAPTDGLSPGDDYNQRANWPDLLEAHGWVEVHRQGERRFWRRPGKTGDGCSATTGNVSAAGNDLLCVFSTSAHPFDGPNGNRPCSSHTKFDAYARLHHEGDHAAAARELRAIGYGDAVSALSSSTPSIPSDAPEPSEPAPDWKPFPTRLLPDPLRSLVTEGAASIHCDEAFVALPGLAVCAGAIGATRTVRIKNDWRAPAVLWCAVVAESGATKSVGRELVLAPLHAMQKRALREYERRMREFGPLNLEHERELAQWKRGKSEGPPPEAPEKPQPMEFVVNDATVEALVRVLQANPRGLLMEADELATWFGSYNKYHGGGGDAQAWIAVHGAGAIKVNRVSLDKPLYVPCAAVSVSGTIQPEILTKALSGEHTASGLAARLLMAHPPRRAKRWSDHEVSRATQDDYARRVADLLGLAFPTDDEGETYPLSLPLTAAARRRMKAFVDEHGVEGLDRDGGEGAAWSKLEGYAARLALVLQLIDDPDAVEVSDHWLSAGIDLSRWFGNEAARFYRGARETPEDRDARRLAAWIESRGGDVSAREVQQGRRAIKTAADAEAALDRLAAAGLGEWRPVGAGAKGGRPTRRFRLADASTSTQPREPAGASGSVDVDARDAPDGAADHPVLDADGWEAA